MKKIVIASACRTAIGKFGGTLANVPEHSEKFFRTVLHISFLAGNSHILAPRGMPHRRSEGTGE